MSLCRVRSRADNIFFISDAFPNHCLLAGMIPLCDGCAINCFQFLPSFLFILFLLQRLGTILMDQQVFFSALFFGLLRQNTYGKFI